MLHILTAAINWRFFERSLRCHIDIWYNESFSTTNRTCEYIYIYTYIYIQPRFCRVILGIIFFPHSFIGIYQFHLFPPFSRGFLPNKILGNSLFARQHLRELRQKSGTLGRVAGCLVVVSWELSTINLGCVLFFCWWFFSGFSIPWDENHR